jgi:F-type H+-transporting ATPase subunit delta
MSAARIARAAFRVRPSTFRAPIQRRGYADVSSDKIKLTLTLPHQVCSMAMKQLFIDSNMVLESSMDNSVLINIHSQSLKAVMCTFATDFNIRRRRC